MSKNRDFTGKVVLITGSSSGMGAETAVLLAKLGADVVITGRNGGNLLAVAKDIKKVSPKGENGVLQVVADISKDDDCRKLIGSTIEKFGKLDILVNNAGMGILTPITDPQIMDNYDKIMNINLRPVLLLTHLAVPHLEKTKGVIINVSSVGGIRPFPPMTVYCMSKSAMDMLTKCLALELGPKGIRVNVINPAGVMTNFGVAMGIPKEMADKAFEKSGKHYALGRIGQSEDIANAIAFLASDNASFITGINFIADGGALWSNMPSIEELMNL